jgi:hypothetical protein
VALELLHPVLHNHVRRSARDPRRWNEACDYAINSPLLDDGLCLPEDVLVGHRFRGMSAEQIYNVLQNESEQQADGQNGGNQSNEDGTEDGSPAQVIRVSPRRRSPMAETARSSRTRRSRRVTNRRGTGPRVECCCQPGGDASQTQAGKAVHHQERFRSTRPNQIWAMAFAAD